MKNKQQEDWSIKESGDILILSKEFKNNKYKSNKDWQTLLYQIGKSGKAKEIIDGVINSAILEERKEYLKFLKRMKLEFDVNVCECGEEWKYTDGAKYIKEEIKLLRQKIGDKI
jgi:hypothetical protein